MPWKYNVHTGYPFEEIGQINYDSINNNDLTARNDVGRRLGKHSYARDFQTFIDQCKNTYCQTIESALNMTTFTCWGWFDCDVPVNDVVILSRGQWGQPSWSIRTLSGNIAFEIGDGISYSHSIVGPKVLQGDHFVAISYNDTTGETVLYYDGVVVNTGVSPIYMPTDQIGVAVGQYVNGGVPFNGWIDSILFTNLVLTTTDLDTIYNNGAGRDIIWFFDLTNLGEVRCIYRNRVVPLYRQEVKTCFRNRIKTLEVEK